MKKRFVSISVCSLSLVIADAACSSSELAKYIARKDAYFSEIRRKNQLKAKQKAKVEILKKHQASLTEITNAIRRIFESLENAEKKSVNLTEFIEKNLGKLSEKDAIRIGANLGLGAAESILLFLNPNTNPGVAETNLVKRINPAELIALVDPAKMVELADPAKLVKLVDPVKLVVLVDSTKLVKLVDPAKLVALADPAKLVKLADPSKLIELVDPAKLVELINRENLVDPEKLLKLVDFEKLVNPDPAKLLKLGELILDPVKLELIDPVELLNHEKLRELIDSAKLLELAADPEKLMELTELMLYTAKLVEKMDPANLVKHVDPAKLVELVDSAKLVKLTDPKKLIELANPAEVIELADSEKLAKLVAPAKLVELVDPEDLVELAEQAIVEKLVDKYTPKEEAYIKKFEGASGKKLAADFIDILLFSKNVNAGTKLLYDAEIKVEVRAKVLTDFLPSLADMFTERFEMTYAKNVLSPVEGSMFASVAAAAFHLKKQSGGTYVDLPSDKVNNAFTKGVTESKAGMLKSISKKIVDTMMGDECKSITMGASVLDKIGSARQFLPIAFPMVENKSDLYQSLLNEIISYDPKLKSQKKAIEEFVDMFCLYKCTMDNGTVYYLSSDNLSSLARWYTGARIMYFREFLGKEVTASVVDDFTPICQFIKTLMAHPSYLKPKLESNVGAFLLQKVMRPLNAAPRLINLRRDLDPILLEANINIFTQAAIYNISDTHTTDTPESFRNFTVALANASESDITRWFYNLSSMANGPDQFCAKRFEENREKFMKAVVFSGSEKLDETINILYYPVTEDYVASIQSRVAVFDRYSPTLVDIFKSIIGKAYGDFSPPNIDQDTLSQICMAGLHLRSRTAEFAYGSTEEIKNAFKSGVAYLASGIFASIVKERALDPKYNTLAAVKGSIPTLSFFTKIFPDTFPLAGTNVDNVVEGIPNNLVKLDNRLSGEKNKIAGFAGALFLEKATAGGISLFFRDKKISAKGATFSYEFDDPHPSAFFVWYVSAQMILLKKLMRFTTGQITLNDDYGEMFTVVNTLLDNLNPSDIESLNEFFSLLFVEPLKKVYVGQELPDSAFANISKHVAKTKILPASKCNTIDATNAFVDEIRNGNVLNFLNTIIASNEFSESKILSSLSYGIRNAATNQINENDAKIFSSILFLSKLDGSDLRSEPEIKIIKSSVAAYIGLFKSNNIINDAPSFIADSIKIIADNGNSFGSSNIGLLIKKMLLDPLVKSQLLTRITSANISTMDIVRKVDELKAKLGSALNISIPGSDPDLSTAPGSGSDPGSGSGSSASSSSSSSILEKLGKLAYALMYCKSVGSSRQYTPITADADIASAITTAIQPFLK